MREFTPPQGNRQARIRSPGGWGNAWVRVQREISQVARQAAGQVDQRWFSRASALLFELRTNRNRNLVRRPEQGPRPPIQHGAEQLEPGQGHQLPRVGVEPANRFFPDGPPGGPTGLPRLHVLRPAGSGPSHAGAGVWWGRRRWPRWPLVVTWLDVAELGHCLLHVEVGEKRTDQSTISDPAQAKGASAPMVSLAACAAHQRRRSLLRGHPER
jgi:hypothetical protein